MRTFVRCRAGGSPFPTTVVRRALENARSALARRHAVMPSAYLDAAPIYRHRREHRRNSESKPDGHRCGRASNRLSAVDAAPDPFDLRLSANPFRGVEIPPNACVV